MRTQVAADLRAAADVLERDGWTQGNYNGPGRCHCLVGAVSVVLGGEDGESTVPAHNGDRLRAARRLLNEQVGGTSDYWFDVVEWNDAPGRTAAEVTAALRAAADRAEADQ